MPRIQSGVGGEIASTTINSTGARRDCSSSPSCSRRATGSAGLASICCFAASVRSGLNPTADLHRRSTSNGPVRFVSMTTRPSTPPRNAARCAIGIPPIRITPPSAAAIPPAQPGAFLLERQCALGARGDVETVARHPGRIARQLEIVEPEGEEDDIAQPFVDEREAIRPLGGLTVGEARRVSPDGRG